MRTKARFAARQKPRKRSSAELTVSFDAKPDPGPLDWRRVGKYARNYVLRLLMDRAEIMEKWLGPDTNTSRERSYALRAAIMMLLKEAGNEK